MPLSDLRVIELATVIAGPGCGRYLADFGADVIKVERPDGGDSSRTLGWRHPDGDTLWWKLEGRNKRSIALDLKDPADKAFLLELVDDADVLIENFRPGKLAALGLGPDVLLARNPRLVVTRITGFGQDGPHAHLAAFATLAEAMSGFAAVNGSPESGPTLPPIALTDEVAGLAAAFATLVAVRSGRGQTVDVNLREAMLQVMGPLASLAALTGEALPRMGSQLPYTAPRNTYECADGRWVAVSTSSDTVAARVMALIGVGDDERFATAEGRTTHRDAVDAAVAEWIAARPTAEVLAAFEQADAACAPVLDMTEIIAEQHLHDSRAFVDVDGTLMQGLVARLSETPGSIRRPAPALGEHTTEIRPDRPEVDSADGAVEFPGVLDIAIDQPDDQNHSVLRPTGELDAYTVAQFREALAGQADTPRLIIDLSEVPFMDSAGLGALIGGIRRARESDGRVVVFCDRPTLTRLLHTTGFDRIVPVEESMPAAVEALDRDPDA